MKSKLEELIEKLCPNGVEYRELGEIGKFTRGNGLQKKDFREKGKPVIHYGEIYTKYGFLTEKTFSFTDEEIYNKLRKAKQNDILIATTSENIEDVAKCVVWRGKEEIGFSGDMYSFTTKENSKYVAYYFQTDFFQKQKRSKVTGTKVIRIHANDMEKFKIPIPPLEIQEEIVRVLDKFTELTTEIKTELATELTLRKQQYEHYRDKLLTFGDEVEWKSLGEIGEVKMCKRILKEQTTSVGDIPFYKIGTFGKTPDAYISRNLFDEYKSKYSYPQKGEILISASGTIGRTVIFDGEDSYFQDSNIVWISNNENKVLNKYLFYYYKIIKWAVAEGGTIKRLYNDMIRKTTIPVPPLEEQKRIVEILDRFDKYINDIKEGLPAEIEMRQKQYEHYRDNLLDFKKLNVEG